MCLRTRIFRTYPGQRRSRDRVTQRFPAARSVASPGPQKTTSATLSGPGRAADICELADKSACSCQPQEPGFLLTCAMTRPTRERDVTTCRSAGDQRLPAMADTFRNACYGRLSRPLPACLTVTRQTDRTGGFPFPARPTSEKPSPGFGIYRQNTFRRSYRMRRKVFLIQWGKPGVTSLFCG